MPHTNELFTHDIGSDPTIKDVRTSLTFRHLISHPLDLKNPRLDFITLLNDPKLNLDLFAVSPDELAHCPPLKRTEPKPDISHEDEWFTRSFKELDEFFQLVGIYAGTPMSKLKWIKIVT